MNDKEMENFSEWLMHMAMTVLACSIGVIAGNSGITIDSNKDKMLVDCMKVMTGQDEYCHNFVRNEIKAFLKWMMFQTDVDESEWFTADTLKRMWDEWMRRGS